MGAGSGEVKVVDVAPIFGNKKVERGQQGETRAGGRRWGIGEGVVTGGEVSFQETLAR